MAPTSSVAPKASPARSFADAFEAFFSMQRESAAMRFIARGVLTTWLLPLFFALFATLQTPAAQAQGVPAQSVIVLDFATGSGLDPLLGRKAADGLAVELQRSGSYDVVPRQRIEQAVDQQAGLQPPYNNTAQIKLAEAVNASSVFSGTITGVALNAGKSARVTMQVSQLDVITGDPINGTVVSESTEQKLGTIDNEILIDEAINKSVFAAVRSMRQTTLPKGAVLNVGVDEFVLNIGADGGAAVGQKYTILRDTYDAARNVTERRKIGEAVITRVNASQSNARLSAGGAQGVKTGDRVRQIFAASNYPVTSLRNGSSTTPVTGPPVRSNGSNAAGGLLKKSSKGLLGIAGLAALAAFAGFGGGGSGTNPPRPLDITEANPTQVYPQPVFRFDAGFSGINFSQTLDRESVVAYLIYRGTAPSFTPDISNLQAVIDARFDAGNKVVTFTDAGVIGSFPFRRTTITSTQPVGGNNGNNGTTSGTSGIEIVNTEVNVPQNMSLINVINVTNNQINIQFTQQPFLVGQTYYYRVGRITAERQRVTNTGTNTGNNGNVAANTTTVNLLPVRSPVSDAIGGYTPLFLPVIVDETKLPNGGNFRYDTDNFSLLVGFDATAFFGQTVNVAPNGGTVILGNLDASFAYLAPQQFYVGAGVNQFRFEVSTSQAFPRGSTFVSPDIPNPGFDGPINPIRLSLGNGSNIRIPSSSQNPYIPGVTTLYARVLARNTNDVNPTFRVSPTLVINRAAGLDRVGRFLPTPSGSSTDSFNLTRPGSTGLSRTNPSAPPRVRVPQ